MRTDLATGIRPSWLALLLFTATIGVCALGAESSENGQPSARRALPEWITGEVVERAQIPSPVPARVAVLPVAGELDDDDRRAIRLAVHNHLSGTPFSLVKPFELDRRLLQLEQRRNVEATALSRAELAAALELDGLIEIRVLDLSQIYALAYAEQKVGLELRLYDARGDAVVWADRQSSSERAGGVSLDIMSVVASAITSAGVLRDTVRVALIDETARKLAQRIPVPEASSAYRRPPAMEALLSNAAEGPFSVGDAIRIFMRAEPGLVATFSIDRSVHPGDQGAVSMTEEQPGEYAGRYVVRRDDDTPGAVVSVVATRPADRARATWGVPGVVRIDTRAPEFLTRATAKPVADGIQLLWSRSVDAHAYRLARADLDQGRFASLGEIQLARYLDRSAELEAAYVYRITPLDAAGNEGRPTLLHATRIAPGPTTLPERIGRDRRLHALGNPHRVAGRVEVLPGVLLSMAPGVELDMAPGAELVVRGRLEIGGNGDAPVRVSGRDWTLAFRGGSGTPSRLDGVRMEAEQAEIRLLGSSVVVADAHLAGLSVLELLSGAKLAMVRSTIRSGGGLRIVDGRVELERVRLEGLETALDLRRGGAFAQRGLSLVDNMVHLRTRNRIELLDVDFGAESFGELRARLHGPVDLRWTGGDDPRTAWFDERWQAVTGALRAARWDEALQLLAGLREQAGQAALAGEVAALVRGVGRDAGAVAGLPVAVSDALRAGAALELWVQQVPLGAVGGDFDSAVFLRRRMGEQFAEDYLRARAIDPERCRRRCDLVFDDHVVSSSVLRQETDGRYRTAWVLHVLDRGRVERRLTSLGLLGAPGERRVLGVFAAELPPLVLARLTGFLSERGIEVRELAARGPGEEGAELARAAGLETVLKPTVQFDLGASRVGGSLRRIDARLRIEVFDVASGRQLQHFEYGAAAIGFRVDAARREVVDKMLTGLEGSLVPWLLEVP